MWPGPTPTEGSRNGAATHAGDIARDAPLNTQVSNWGFLPTSEGIVNQIGQAALSCDRPLNERGDPAARHDALAAGLRAAPNQGSARDQRSSRWRFSRTSFHSSASTGWGFMRVIEGHCLAKFPAGRARLATNPLPTGSLSCAMTIGMVEVASLSARVAGGALVMMTSTLRRASSAASAGRRSSFPSANRHSMTMFFPLRSHARADLVAMPRRGPTSWKGWRQLGILSGGFSLAAAPWPQLHTWRTR